MTALFPTERLDGAMAIRRLRSNYKATIQQEIEHLIKSQRSTLDKWIGISIKFKDDGFGDMVKSTGEELSKLEQQLIDLPSFLANDWVRSQVEPVLLNMYCDRGNWLYQDAVYEVTGNYSDEERKLLLLEFADKERQKFERLKAKFSKEQTQHIKYERSRIPENVRIEVWRRDQGKCVDCGSRENLEYDHIVPVSRGGSNTARNVELLCEVCNREKGNRIQ